MQGDQRGHGGQEALQVDDDFGVQGKHKRQSPHEQNFFIVF